MKPLVSDADRHDNWSSLLTRGLSFYSVMEYEDLTPCFYIHIIFTLDTCPCKHIVFDYISIKTRFSSSSIKSYLLYQVYGFINSLHFSWLIRVLEKYFKLLSIYNTNECYNVFFSFLVVVKKYNKNIFNLTYFNLYILK